MRRSCSVISTVPLSHWAKKPHFYLAFVSAMSHSLATSVVSSRKKHMRQIQIFILKAFKNMFFIVFWMLPDLLLYAGFCCCPVSQCSGDD